MYLIQLPLSDLTGFVLEERQLLYLAHILLKPSSVVLIEESKILTNLSLHDQLFDVSIFLTHLYPVPKKRHTTLSLSLGIILYT